MLKPFESLITRTVTDGTNNPPKKHERDLEDHLAFMGMASTIQTVQEVKHVTPQQDKAGFFA